MRTPMTTRGSLLLAVLVLTACGAAGSNGSSSPATQSDMPQVASQAAPQVDTLSPTELPTAMPAPTVHQEPDQVAPELVGGQSWINSEPLTLSELRGKVVLVDFWTYGCYNCKNTLPSLQSWWRTYKDQGFVIVGVHSPEFNSEAVLENVQQATHDLGVSWPVVQDNDHAIWSAYRNNYWPHVYLIDKHGNIIYDHIGEGAYEETERQIQAALAQNS